MEALNMGGASRNCYCCGSLTAFFNWSTGRWFPREKLMKIKKITGKMDRNRIFVEGVPICFQCCDELKKNE